MYESSIADLWLPQLTQNDDATTTTTGPGGDTHSQDDSDATISVDRIADRAVEFFDKKRCQTRHEKR